MDDFQGDLSCQLNDCPIAFRTRSARSGLGLFEHLFEPDLGTKSSSCFGTSARLREFTSNLIKMTDFFDKGFAVVDLIDPRFASDVWRDMDQDEIRKLLDTIHEKPWKSLENFPQTRSLLNFSQEVDDVSCYSLLESRWILTVE